MTSGGEKAEDAFRTIGELSAELGIQQHILRYWETRFPQLRPLQRAGNRRYYRPADAALVRRIHSLLNEQGYTIRGVQKLLAQKAPPAEQTPEPATPAPIAPQPVLVVNQSTIPSPARAELQAIRESLVQALAADMD
ncbi:MerR family transcriptional regulator [Sphingomonas histidinilytica]|jgi:DNA-binding transcriptional MerR regulator|uniref:MerR HTH family regulatory protein n=1 Tax=Rhizorhabdus histidinilytica TaxID=439228 RepID=A0A1T5AL86_9SPHN|nr:MerR family transcriptional regulator [Rhizorhabdus histidinilytica]MBO9376790.1 MerR family transcriptional regulator [Rhizorhabdus histidinilytica]QEH79767.1 MerR family transcriptional regulator [Sphingomonas sp. C8-2]SKB35738.1 MerR HTH family regulatory protein [Rhizorhabdus histidinilytica]